MLQITISKRSALILAVVMLLVIPLAAYAGTVFDDVDDTSTHIDGITFMKDSGVSVGCDANNNYCPGDNVTRAQMGTFMYRLSGNDPATDPSVNAAELDGAGPLAYTTQIDGIACSTTDCDDLTAAEIGILAELAVDFPAAGTTQVSYGFTGSSDPTTTNLVQVWVTYDDDTCSWFFAPTDSVPGGYVHHLQGADNDLMALSGSTVLDVPAGTHTLRLCVLSFNVDMTTSDATISSVWSANGAGSSPSSVASLQGVDEIAAHTGS